MLFKHYLILLICVWGTTVFAQSETSKHMIGLEVGASRNWWSYGSGSAYGQGVKERYSFVTGLNYRYRLNPYISLGGTCLYEKKGVMATVSFSYTGNGRGGNTGDANQNLEYLTLSPQVYVGIGKRVRPMLAVGPYIGYMVNNYALNSGTVLSTPSSPSNYDLEVFGAHETGVETGAYFDYYNFNSFKIDHNFNRLDYGLNLSLGLDLDLGKNWHLVTSLRRSMGLAEVVKRSDIQSNQRNQSLVFSMAALYSF